MSVTDKFLDYVSLDTQSDETSTTAPSTKKQLVLARKLEEELKQIGVSNVELSEYGVVYGEIPATQGFQGDAIGLISHMDTASELSGASVHPQRISKYDGGTIALGKDYSMNPEMFPSLKEVIGDDILVTDGTTLLGADDKAGCAIIMETLEQLIQSGKPHGKVMVAFTPDEEIGRGVAHFDLNRFPVDYAYTVDGAEIENVDYQTFNAAMAEIQFKGQAIHPGSAKGKMVNAAAVAVQFASMLPQWARPEFTEGTEGFIHLLEVKGDCDQASLQYIIRDHNREKFEQKKQLMKDITNVINEMWPDCATITMRDQYSNLEDAMHGDMRAVERAKAALKACGITPKSDPIRGGTDGASLTWKGLITPNLGTGGNNFHGRYEFVSIQKMEKMTDVLLHLLKGNLD